MPSPVPTGIAPTSLVAPPGVRRAAHDSTGTSPAIRTVSGSPAPTAIGVPGNHGLSDPPPPQV